mmetsp:Transcript_23898/g.60853  ORF Transcript_23898/g.60853 Transcript_23898/m.60853 type:complete len:510 (-) Transcript_23898:551-2080(-)
MHRSTPPHSSNPHTQQAPAPLPCTWLHSPAWPPATAALRTQLPHTQLSIGARPAAAANSPSSDRSVVVGDLAAVHRGARLRLHHAAVHHLAVRDPVVGRLQPRHHLALHVRDGGLEHGALVLGGEPLHALEAVRAGREALQEVLERHIVVVLAQRVEHKGVAHLHERLDGAVLGHRDGEPQRLERRLRHPGRDHGGARVVVRRGHHVQAGRDARERLGHVRAHGRLLALNHLLLRQRLSQVSTRLLVRLVQRLRGQVLDAQRGEHLSAHVHAARDQLVHRLVLAAVRLGHDDPRLGLERGRERGERGARLAAVVGRRHEDDAAAAPHHRHQLLRVGAQHVHHLGLHARLGHAARQRLAQPVAEAVLGRVQHRHAGGGLAHGGGPRRVVVHELGHVEAQDGAVPVGDEREGQVLDLAQRGGHRLGVGLHQAVVVEAVVGQDGLQVHVVRVLAAVVHAKRVAREHDACGVVERKHGVGPVQVGRHDKLDHVAAPQVDLVAALHRLLLERPV